MIIMVFWEGNLFIGERYDKDNRERVLIKNMFVCMPAQTEGGQRGLQLMTCPGEPTFMDFPYASSAIQDVKSKNVMEVYNRLKTGLIIPQPGEVIKGRFN